MFDSQNLKSSAVSLDAIELHVVATFKLVPVVPH